MDQSLNLLPHHGNVYFYPGFFSPNESDRLFNALLNEVPWKQEPIKIFGKEMMQPRLTAWYGDEGVSYSYSGITMAPLMWTPTLIHIKQKIEAASSQNFNSALLNLYRDGNDSMGWHRDNEKELGIHPAIGSVNFGATRRFQMRTYKEKTDLLSIDLTHGSFLLSCGETQPYWEHRVPKTTQAVGPRINITFRLVK